MKGGHFGTQSGWPTLGAQLVLRERQDRLPVQLTTFVGRERETVEVVLVLETTRLLTLVGTGGIGKTRLATGARPRRLRDLEPLPRAEPGPVSVEGIGDRQILRRGLWVAGVLAVKRGEFARGVRMFAASAGSPGARVSLDPDELQAWDGCLAAARAKLGTPGFDDAWADGLAMTLEEAIAYGLTRERPTLVQKQQHEALALTQREREVAALIAEGCSNREIAERLVISLRTAEAHVSNLLSKVGVRSRAQLAVPLMQRELR